MSVQNRFVKIKKCIKTQKPNFFWKNLHNPSPHHAPANLGYSRVINSNILRAVTGSLSGLRRQCQAKIYVEARSLYLKKKHKVNT